MTMEEFHGTYIIAKFNQNLVRAGYSYINDKYGLLLWTENEPLYVRDIIVFNEPVSYDLFNVFNFPKVKTTTQITPQPHFRLMVESYVRGVTEDHSFRLPKPFTFDNFHSFERMHRNEPLPYEVLEEKILVAK